MHPPVSAPGEGEGTTGGQTTITRLALSVIVGIGLGAIALLGLIARRHHRRRGVRALAA
jgi:hypothetical protein